MEKLKVFSKLSIFAIFVLVFLSHFTGVHAIFTLNNITSNNNSTCFRKVSPLSYEIHIGPIKNSSDPVRVPCWVKIKAEIGENECRSTISNNSATFISLYSRNSIFDVKNINVSKEGIDKQVELLTFHTNSVEIPEKSHSSMGAPDEYIFQFENNRLKIGDQILFYIPYEIELKRDYPKGTYEGLYYYDPTDNIDTESLFYFPLHARYIFPVVKNADPFHKPTYKLSVARFGHDGFVSVSNTDIVETVVSPEMGKGWVTDHFRESPPIKIDQVTLFILRGFENHSIYTENINHSNKTRAINLWTMKNNSYTNETIFHTLFEIQRFMDYFSGMFNETDYPFKKIDFVTVPWNTASLSWQKSNLGIVISSNNDILSYKKGLRESKENVDLYEFIASQIALQWFRGLTSSNDEFDNVALSGETLAVYVTNWVLKYTTQQIPPFLNQNYETELPSLLNMMEYIFSREVLQYAICKTYLPKSIENGTFPSNLWMAIHQSLEFHNKTDVLPPTGENGTVKVSEIFNSWIKNINKQPIIRINQVENATDSIEIYQEYTPEADLTDHIGWWVPVHISTGNGHVAFWVFPNNTLNNSSKIYQDSDLIDTKDGWIFVNPDVTKYYDVHYSEKIMTNIITQLKQNHTVFPAKGREDLIAKQFTVASKDNTWESLEMALEMTKYLDKEMDKDVWGNVIWGMSRFNGKFMQQPSSFQVYFGGKINQVLETIGLFPKPDDKEDIAELRQLLLEFSYFYEIPLVIEYGSELMSQWMENITINPFQEKLASEVRQAFYCTALSHSVDDSVFNFMYDQMVNQNHSGELNGGQNETQRICKALSCARNDEILVSLLVNNSELANSDNRILQTCFRQQIPFEILWQKPLTMKKVVYDFWMKYNLFEYQIPANQPKQHKFLIPWSYEPMEYSVIGYLDSIKYWNLRDHVKFFTEDSMEKRKSSLMSITWVANELDEKANTILNNSQKWFAMQL